MENAAKKNLSAVKPINYSATMIMTSLVHMGAKMLAPTRLKMTLTWVKNTALKQENKNQNVYHIKVP